MNLLNWVAAGLTLDANMFSLACEGRCHKLEYTMYLLEQCSTSSLDSSDSSLGFVETDNRGFVRSVSN